MSDTRTPFRLQTSVLRINEQQNATVCHVVISSGDYDLHISCVGLEIEIHLHLHAIACCISVSSLWSPKKKLIKQLGISSILFASQFTFLVFWDEENGMWPDMRQLIATESHLMDSHI